MTIASGILLTGGRSRRLGRDKALLVVDGTTLAERNAAVLGAVCDVVVEVGPGYTALPAVCEHPAGAGPLAAIAAGSHAVARLGGAGALIVLAVDLPRITVEVVELLRDWPGAPTAVPDVGERLQPLCARYGPEALVAADSLLAAGVSSMHALLDVAEHDVVTEREWGRVASAEVFADVDSPEDAARLGIAFDG